MGDMPFLIKCAWISGDWKLREGIWATRSATAGEDAAEEEDGWIWIRAIFTMVEEVLWVVVVEECEIVDSTEGGRAAGGRKSSTLIWREENRLRDLAGRHSK